MEMNVINKSGEWLVNTAMFRAVFNLEAKPDSPAIPVVIFEPGVPTKVDTKGELGDWLLGQSMIVSCPDPMNSDEPIPTVIVPMDNVVVPTNDVTGLKDPSAAPGIQGSAAEAPALTPENAAAPANLSPKKK